MKALTFAGFNVLTLANNHIMDYGTRGLQDTMDLCNELGVEFLGAGNNLLEASQPLIKKLKGHSIAFLNFAENEFSTTFGMQPGANPLDPVSNFHAIRKAKQEADFVIVIIHGGHENYSLPSPRMKEQYRFMVEAGADAVVGHHTHCYSGFELYLEKPIFYSIGNFLFDSSGKRNMPWNFGFAVQFKIQDQKLDFEIIPFEQNNENPGVRVLSNEKKKQFDENIHALNAVIADDSELERRFNTFVNSVKKQYTSFLEPHSNKYLFALQNRRFLPSFLSKKKGLLYKNLISCESHREVLLKIIVPE
jgi:poly-gamma-glutamate synthesis protein (capsule biosynthesis protein)